MSLEGIEDFFEDHGVGITFTVGIMLFIGFTGWCCYGIWEEENTAETIVMHNGSKSYACVVSRANQTLHDCHPVKEQAE